jgi:low temperature requirement protein LtrA
MTIDNATKVVRYRAHVNSTNSTTMHTPPVAYVELFYDLVMVATVIVFSSKVSHDLSAHNIVWFILVFAMLWWAWLSTTLVLNTARQNDVIVQFLIAIEMLGITLMTILVSDHLGSDRLTVSPTYGAIIFIVALLNEWLRVRGPAEGQGIAARRRNAFIVSAILWAAAGFLPAPIHGIAWIAAAVMMVIPILWPRFSRGLTLPPLDEEHLVERFALLTLLVIGECFIKVALTATSKGIHEINLLVLPIEIGLIFAIWAVYFTNVVPRGLPRTLTARRAWMGYHLVLQIGLVGLAIGLGRLIALLDISTSKREDAYSLAIPLAIVFVALGLLIRLGWGRAGQAMALVLVGGALASLLLGILVIEIQPFTINEGAMIFGIVEIGAAGVVAWLGRTTWAALERSDD